MEAPKANPEKLLTILQDAYNGKVVLPEFQRDFIWSRDRIEELLVSILQGYFVGTLLLLDTPTSTPLFPYRAIEGLQKVNPSAQPGGHSTIRLALDGQQRLTSLFYVLYEPDIPLRNTSQTHRFYFRVDLALAGDAEDAVVGIPVGSKRRMTEMNEFVKKHQAIPFSLLRDSGALYRWLYIGQKFLTLQKDVQQIETFCKAFTDFMIPVVSLPSVTNKNDIVNIFERINRTGVSLSTFDLAVARLYRKAVPLRKFWDKFKNDHPAVADAIKPESLLKFICLMTGVVPRKSNLVDVADKLSKLQFEANWDTATVYMAKAYSRLTHTTGGYGAFADKWIPYTTILVPLAYLLMETEKMKAGQAEYRKLDAWYWASVFSERYDSAIDTKASDDIKDVVRWLKGGAPPNWLRAFNSAAVDLTVDEQRSAVYRGVMCLIALRGAKDYCNGQKAALHQCDDDHIFPFSQFKKHADVNGVANRTLIDPDCNRQIKRAKKPPVYLPIFLKKHGNDVVQLRRTLKSHFISAEALVAMRASPDGKFDEFVVARKREIAREIQKRTNA